VIIDDAETLGEDAQQALLKTLEDAPGYVSIILITTSIEAILDTVHSRSVEVPFQLVSTSEISAGLNRIRATSDADEIAHLAQGRAGWAVAALDSPETLDRERVENEEIARWIAASARDRLVEAYRRGDALVTRRVSSPQVQRNVDQATLVWRDLLLTATGNDQLAFDPERVRRIDQSSRLTPANAYQALAACRQCQFDLSHNVRPKLALELMVNQWPILS
jgi:DNA polymerase-3 subunit delta'